MVTCSLIGYYLSMRTPGKIGCKSNWASSLNKVFIIIIIITYCKLIHNDNGYFVQSNIKLLFTWGKFHLHIFEIDNEVSAVYSTNPLSIK